jgi:hypothetical protein
VWFDIAKGGNPLTRLRNQLVDRRGGGGTVLKGGHPVGAGARLGTLPPVASLVSIGDGGTLELDVDAHGWWLEGDELVVDELRIGARARVPTRTLLAPGAEIGAKAESGVDGSIPPGERWSGSPATRVGSAGRDWPGTAPARAPRFRRAMVVAAPAAQAVLPLATAPGLVLLVVSGAGRGDHGTVTDLLTRPR